MNSINICVLFAFAADPKLELYKVPDLPLPHLPKGVPLSPFNFYPPESRAGQKLCPSPSPSPPGHSTIKTLFRIWLAAAFPTFDQGTLKAIQCPCPARKPMGRVPLWADTKTHCARRLWPEQGAHVDYQ